MKAFESSTKNGRLIYIIYKFINQDLDKYIILKYYKNFINKWGWGWGWGWG